MLSEVEIQNFLRIDDSMRLALGPVTVLVGENGSGKSSVLKAIHWAVRCATLSDTKGRLTLEQMDFVPSKDFLELSHKLKLQNSSQGRKILVKFHDNEGKITEIRIGAARNDAGVNVSIEGNLATSLKSPEKPSTAYIPGLAGTSEEETILAVPVMHRKAASGEGGSVLRQILLNHAAGNDGTGEDYVYLEELSKWVSKVLPDSKFWVKFDRLRDRNIHVKFWTPEMKVAGQSERIAWKAIDMAGTGFLQVVQIFAYFLYFKPTLLLIDEPDAHLHPGRQQKLIKALEEAVQEFASTQVILTTHSPSLVRSLSASAKIHWLENGAVKANGSVVRERMGWSALDKDVIIFTEDGNTKRLQSLLDQWPEISHRCAIWPTFGKDALPYGSRAKKLAEKMGIRVLLHRDRDFMSDADVADWKALREYTHHQIPVWFTTRADIESEFCVVEHIKNIIDIDDVIAGEIISMAWSFFDEPTITTEFSNAYQSAVSKLAATPDRNPIARWNALGGFGVPTVKGKDYLKAIQKACLNVLPSHGLGTRISRRDAIGYGHPKHPLAPTLREAIANILP